MRHAPLSILAIIAVVGIAVMLLSVSLVQEPSFMAVMIGPQPVISGGGNTVVVRLEVGEFLSNEITALSESQLSGLRSGSIHAKDSATDYTQSLRFSEPGVFNGGHSEFGKDENNVVTDMLQFDSGDAIFKYQIDFGSGLRSKVEGGKLPDIEDESFEMLGETFTILDASTSGTRVTLRFFGGLGSVEFEDNNFNDDVYYTGGVKVNGQNVASRIKIKATLSSGGLNIYSIQYILNADAVQGGDVQVTPLHCVREFLQYPTGMLSSNFDICYKGLGAASVGVTKKGVSGNEVHMKPAGDDQYQMLATNTRGMSYKIPVAQLPGMYGNKGRNFVFVEAAAPAAPNIMLNDYFLVNSKNDVTGVSNVLRYDNIDTTNQRVIFEDLAGAQRQATYDAGGAGQLLVGEGTYMFQVGAGNALAMDQTNNGAIAGNEARFVLAGGSRVDFGPGFVITVTTPQKLFDDPTSDENSIFNILFGGDIDLAVPSPQVTMPGYTFKMVSESSGVKQGMTKFGILYTLEDNGGNSADLQLTVPGSYSGGGGSGAGAEVYITLERQKLMKPAQQTPAAVAKCGDKIITKPEYCDPPGSLCADQFKRSGVCSPDCASCSYITPAVCGNKLLDKGEMCEATADCPQGSMCSNCQCLPLPRSACGNRLLEQSEQCEAPADCPAGLTCSACACVPAPQQQLPAQVVKQPNIFARFFSWLAGLFGG